MTIEKKIISDREQWLAWRREDVTASAVGALFGAHPYMTALKLYAEKSGVEFPEKESGAMRRGRWFEPAVCAAVQELRPDWYIEPPGIYLRNPDIRLGATPDFFIWGDPRGPGVLQAKTTTRQIFERDWQIEPPLWIQLQTMVEMMLAQATFGAIALMIVDPFDPQCEIFDLQRHADAEAKIITAVKQFWADVEAGKEPEPDFARDAEAIRALTARSAPGKSIDLSGNNELPIALEQRALLMERIDRDKARKEEIENQIRFLMADAETGIGLDGWKIDYKMSDRKEYTVPAKRTRVLRIYDRRAAP